MENYIDKPSPNHYQRQTKKFKKEYLVLKKFGYRIELMTAESVVPTYNHCLKIMRTQQKYIYDSIVPKLSTIDRWIFTKLFYPSAKHTWLKIFYVWYFKNKIKLIEHDFPFGMQLYGHLQYSSVVIYGKLHRLRMPFIFNTCEPSYSFYNSKGERVEL
jgi:hypothetical protein